MIDGGDQEWYQNGQLHRDNDLPAVILTNGTQKWYKNGLLHREHDLPAIIYPSGEQIWYKNGKYHRQKKTKNKRIRLKTNFIIKIV